MAAHIWKPCAARCTMQDWGNAGALGIEPNALPYGAAEYIAQYRSNAKLVDVTPALEPARIVKTAREITLLRRTAHIGDVGHMTQSVLVKVPERNEFEMWGELTARMNHVVGHDITVVREPLSGPRTTTVNHRGGPCDRVTELGDAVLMDVSQRIDGYWSDGRTHASSG